MRLLVAEDEIRMQEAIKELLVQNNFLVDTVDNGAAAFEAAMKNSYDAIILDIMMPSVDGLTVTDLLRKYNNFTPILLLTARTNVSDKVDGLNKGADDYLTKPFEPMEFIARISALTRRYERNKNQYITFADLKFDASAYQLICGSKQISLSNKEYKVLEKLLASPSSVVSKETLLTSVWGFDSEVRENNIEAYISFIRRKLEYLESKVKIKAVRNAGYRLESNDD